ncbi:MAG: iron-containing alcohol dehydrogenase [Burkholderiales bacterium]
MHIPDFSISRLPRIEFGNGSRRKLPGLLARYGKRLLVVTGGKRFRDSLHWQELSEELLRQGFSWESFAVNGEPSPQLVDQAVQDYRNAGIEAVLAIGGGSVLDAAKAIAGLLKPGNSVMDHLEGVGPEHPYRGPSTPFIAVPTTAGTGSEATKNAVLSVQGEGGYKKSFRDEQLVPEYAVLDPELLESCPPGLIAANGMDALTQLLESFVSTRANPFTDALALSGIAAVRDGFFEWVENGPDAAAGREKMAYAALLSGIALAQAGLGSVHGLAAPLGAFFPIPHGVACGTLLATATQINIDVMEAREPDNPALKKYAQLGRLFRGRTHVEEVGARVFLVHTLKEWSKRLDLPRLGEFGIGEADVDRVVAHCRGSSMKTNPVVLSDEDVAEIIRMRL